MVISWRRFRARLTAVLHLDEEPSHLAVSMAAGVFIGVTPFYGLHTLLAFAVAWLFRLNKAATVTGAWLNVPWVAPFLYGFCHRLGVAILTGDLSGFSWSTLTELAGAAGEYLRAPREGAGALWQIGWALLFDASRPMFIGTTVVGTVLGVVAYFVTYEAVLNVRRLRRRIHPVEKTTGGGASGGRPVA